MQRARAVLYCHLWSVRLCHIFPHYLTNGTIFKGGRRGVFEHKTCVLIFSILFSETFLVLRIIERDIAINVQKYSRQVLVIVIRY